MKLKYLALPLAGLFAAFFCLLLLVALLFASDEDGGRGGIYYGGANLSAEVLAHRPMVERYAAQYGISEYVDVLLAIMQVESGGTLEDSAANAGNRHPIAARSREEALRLLARHGCVAVPVLDGDGFVTDVVLEGERQMEPFIALGIPVVIMAGGKGTRLEPYTKILPKPLIPVGEQPIAELIMDRFRDFGCHEFTMIVNYKKGMIKSYFNELEKDYPVDFADEEVFMGTGGGLCLLKGKIKAPFFFTNCDTLLDVDFGDIYEYHKSHGNLVTMICAFKHYTVPYGVVELGENGSIAAMREKPELDFLTNTGVYVVEPRVVEEMRDGEKIGFPDVIERYRRAGEKVGVYPISESSWMDMGQLEELEKMRRKLENQQ